MKKNILKNFLSLLLVVVLVLPLFSCQKASYQISETQKTLTLFDEYNLSVTKDGVLTQAEWETSDSAVVSVTSDGDIKGEGVGTATITATIDNNKLTCTVTVLATEIKPVLSLSLSGEVVRKNQPITLSHQLTYGDKSVTPNEITYDSDNPEALSISKISTGAMLTAISSARIVTVTVTANYLGMLATETVTVQTIGDVEIILSDYAIALDVIKMSGENVTEKTVSVIKVLNQGVAVSNVDVTFDSNDPQIATVDSAGKISSVKKGKTFITVTYNDGEKNHQAYVYVEVKESEVDLTNQSKQKLFKQIADGSAKIDISELGLDLSQYKLKAFDSDSSKNITILQTGNIVIFSQREQLPDGEKTILLTAEDLFVVKVPVLVVTMIVKTANDLLSIPLLGEVLDEGDPDSTGAPLYKYDGYYVLNNDVNLGADIVETNFAVIDPATYSGYWGFSGTLDGQGHTVSGGVYGKYGLFGMVSTDAVIKNIAFTNVTLNDKGCTLGHTVSGEITDVLIDVVDKVGEFSYDKNGIAFFMLGAHMKNVVVYIDCEDEGGSYAYATYMGRANMHGWGNRVTTAENCYAIGGHYDINSGYLGYAHNYLLSTIVKDNVKYFERSTTCAQVNFTGLDPNMWDLTGAKACFK